jgi:hypothetical protein
MDTTPASDLPAVVQATSTPAVPPEILEQVLIGGDLSRLTEAQRLAYYRAVCQSLGLNPLTKPFEYLTLNGKLRLYALRDCADQLRRLHGIIIHITNRERLQDIYIVTARAKDRAGREDESTGTVALGALKGDALANALMKAETKAKRRVTLSLAGLGWLDETELETLPGVHTGESNGDHGTAEQRGTDRSDVPEGEPPTRLTPDQAREGAADAGTPPACQQRRDRDQGGREQNFQERPHMAISGGLCGRTGGPASRPLGPSHITAPMTTTDAVGVCTASISHAMAVRVSRRMSSGALAVAACKQ